MSGMDFDGEGNQALINRVQQKTKYLNSPDIPLKEGQAGPNLGALFEYDREQAFKVTKETIRDSVESSFRTGDDPGWDHMQKAMISASCAFFAQEVLTGPPQPPYNGRFYINDHHMEWDKLVKEHERLCILAARDHGKTFFIDFAYPLWKAIKHPGESGFIFSAAQDQAERILGDIKNEVESNPKLQWLVPTRKNKWGSRHLQFSNGHRIYARGFGTKVRGAHPCWIVVDDGLNDETAYSELVRTKQKDYFYTAISNMIIPGGQIVVIGTPFQADDLYADLRENEKYYFQAFPAESNPGKPDNKALWENRYSLQSLEKKKNEIGSIRYTREFLVEPISDDMSLFPSYLFQGDPTEQFNLKLGMPLEFWREAGVTPYMGVDFAMSSSVEADYTVVWTMGVDKHGNRWIIDIQRGKGLPYQGQLSLINKIGRKYDPALIFLEDNQMQRIFGDELIRTSDLPIKKFTTTAQKHSLDKGVPSLRILLENDKFRIPRGDAHSVEATDLWIEEMRSFTWLEGKLQSVGAHDDLVMACYICDQAIKQGGFTFAFGDDYGTPTQEETDRMYAELTGEALPGGLEPEEDGVIANLIGDDSPLPNIPR